jgi:magnesium chelatase family protein
MRVSGPLLDRVDLHVQTPTVPYRRLTDTEDGPASREVRARVHRCRAIQSARFSAEKGLFANGQMGPAEIRRWCRPSRAVAGLLQGALDRIGLSARSYHRILKVARTIADLDDASEIGVKHAAEALQYRALDRRWAA